MDLCFSCQPVFYYRGLFHRLRVVMATSFPPVHLHINKITARHGGWAGTIWSSFGVAASALNLYFWQSGYCSVCFPICNIPPVQGRSILTILTGTYEVGGRHSFGENKAKQKATQLGADAVLFLSGSFFLIGKKILKTKRNRPLGSWISTQFASQLPDPHLRSCSAMATWCFLNHQLS